MQRCLRNAPIRRSTYCKSVFFKLWLVALVVIGLMAFTQAAFAALTIKFDQSAYQGKVWIQVQKATDLTFTATYTNATGTHSINFTDGGTPPKTLLMSVPVLLSDIGAGGLNITYAGSSKIYVFYDDPSGNSRTAAPDHMSPNWPQRYQDFELAMMGNVADYGDLTYINWYSAPLRITSYDASQTKLQQSGFVTTGAEITKQMAAASGGNPKTVMKDASGNILRYLGPSNNFTSKGGNPWPSFIPYTKSIHTAGQSTKIRTNPQGFFFVGEPVPNYKFGVDMTATADADGNLTITGAITASVTGTIKEGNPPIPAGGQWGNTTFYFSAAVPDAFNSAIYGQVETAAVQHWGTGFINFVDFLQRTRKDPTKPYDQNSNPTLLDPPPATNAPVYDTWFRNTIGEVTTGLLAGFFNSPVQVGTPPRVHQGHV